MDSLGLWILIFSFIITYWVSKHIYNRKNVTHYNKEHFSFTIEGPVPPTRAQVLKAKQIYEQNKISNKHYFETKIRPRLNKDLGVSTPNCPYCGTALAKMPTRAMTCKSCKNKFYVRTRPFDDTKVIMTEKDLKKLDYEWKRIGFMKELGDEYFVYEKQLQAIRHTDYIPPTDVVWRKISNDRFDAEVTQDITKLSNALWYSARFLISEEAYSDALEDLLLHMYYNTITIRLNYDDDTANISYIPPVDPWISLQGDIGRCVLQLNLNKKQLINKFLSLKPIIKTGVPLEIYVPNLRKAYDEMMVAKEKFEQEYDTPYLGVKK